MEIDYETGRAESLIKKSQHSWDIAAGILLVEEAGGKVTDFKGNNIEINKERNDVVASNNIIHDQVLDELNKIKFGDKTWFP